MILIVAGFVWAPILVRLTIHSILLVIFRVHACSVSTFLHVLSTKCAITLTLLLQAFECVGKCYVPIGSHLSPTNHAIIQTLVHAAHPKRAARACCVPTKLEPISILYLDENNIITYKYHYDGMVVAECGCRWCCVLSWVNWMLNWILVLLAGGRVLQFIYETCAEITVANCKYYRGGRKQNCFLQVS